MGQLCLVGYSCHSCICSVIDAAVVIRFFLKRNCKTPPWTKYRMVAAKCCFILFCTLFFTQQTRGENSSNSFKSSLFQSLLKAALRYNFQPNNKADNDEKIPPKVSPNFTPTLTIPKRENILISQTQQNPHNLFPAHSIEHSPNVTPTLTIPKQQNFIPPQTEQNHENIPAVSRVQSPQNIFQVPIAENLKNILPVTSEQNSTQIPVSSVPNSQADLPVSNKQNSSKILLVSTAPKSQNILPVRSAQNQQKMMSFTTVPNPPQILPAPNALNSKTILRLPGAQNLRKIFNFLPSPSPRNPPTGTKTLQNFLLPPTPPNSKNVHPAPNPHPPFRAAAAQIPQNLLPPLDLVPTKLSNSSQLSLPLSLDISATMNYSSLMGTLYNIGQAAYDFVDVAMLRSLLDLYMNKRKKTPLARSDLIHPGSTQVSPKEEKVRNNLTILLAGVMGKQQCWEKTFCQLGELAKSLSGSSVFFMVMKSSVPRSWARTRSIIDMIKEGTLRDCKKFKCDTKRT